MSGKNTIVAVVYMEAPGVWIQLPNDTPQQVRDWLLECDVWSVFATDGSPDRRRGANGDSLVFASQDGDAVSDRHKINACAAIPAAITVDDPTNLRFVENTVAALKGALGAEATRCFVLSLKVDEKTLKPPKAP